MKGNESIRNKFVFWLLDIEADLANDKMAFKKFLLLLEEGARKCRVLLYGEK